MRDSGLDAKMLSAAVAGEIGREADLVTPWLRAGCSQEVIG
jgi:hypothetical protein